jgi:hypothetical protein
MNGSFAIDFRPGSHAVPRILDMIGEEGFDLHGLHLIPSCPDRWTLMVDIGGRPAAPELQTLERQLKAYSAVIDVIHNAGAPTAA